jgi:radical SAM-linked protein
MPNQVLIPFGIEGDLCCLSHRETLTMWQRILVRSGLPLVYSAGFNPRPRLSLPLPRPVGVQSDQELLCAQIMADAGETSSSVLSDPIRRLLPEGCTMGRIERTGGRCPTAQEATYVFCRGSAIPPEYWTGQIDQCRMQLNSAEPIQRMRNSPKHPSKSIDLRSYILEVNGNQDDLRIRCRIDQSGTVRPEELLEWLKVSVTDLARPPRRTGVVWIQN